MRNFALFATITIMLAIAGCSPKATISPAAQPLSTPCQSAPWVDGGEEITTDNYRIYTTMSAKRFRVVLPGFMEAALRNYRDLTQIDQPQPELMPMYLMATRAEWATLTESKFGRRGPSSLLENGGYSYKGVNVCWNIGGLATYSVASHEGMHQFLYYHMKNRLPLWAEEGLATSCEGFVLAQQTVRFTPQKNHNRIIDLRTGIMNNHWLDIENLLTTNTPRELRKGQTPGLSYYGQLYALTHFLRNHKTYGPRWRKMIHDAKEGNFKTLLPPAVLKLKGLQYYQTISLPVFKHYITDDLKTFEWHFYRYARELTKLN